MLILIQHPANKIPGELYRNDFRSFNYFQPDFENKEHNDKITNQFLKSSSKVRDFKTNSEPENHQKDNEHILFETTKDETIRVLNNINFNNKRDQLTKSQIIEHY